MSIADDIQNATQLMARAEAAVQNLHRALEGWEDKAGVQIAQAAKNAGTGFAQAAGAQISQMASSAAQEVQGAAKGAGLALGAVQQQAQALEAATKAAGEAIRAAQAAYEQAAGQERATAQRFAVGLKALEAWEQRVETSLDGSMRKLDETIKAVEPAAADALKSMVQRIKECNPKPSFHEWFTHYFNVGLLVACVLVCAALTTWGGYSWGSADALTHEAEHVQAEVRSNISVEAYANVLPGASTDGSPSASDPKHVAITQPLVKVAGVYYPMTKGQDGAWIWNHQAYPASKIWLAAAYDNQSNKTYKVTP